MWFIKFLEVSPCALWKSLVPCLILLFVKFNQRVELGCVGSGSSSNLLNLNCEQIRKVGSSLGA